MTNICELSLTDWYLRRRRELLKNRLEPIQLTWWKTRAPEYLSESCLELIWVFIQVSDSKLLRLGHGHTLCLDARQDATRRAGFWSWRFHSADFIGKIWMEASKESLRVWESNVKAPNRLIYIRRRRSNESGYLISFCRSSHVRQYCSQGVSLQPAFCLPPRTIQGR